MEKPKIVQLDEDVTKLKGNVLFEGNALDNITLSDSVANYNVLKIYYKNVDYLFENSVEVSTSASKTTLMSSICIGDDVKLYSKTINISGSAITMYKTGSIYVSARQFSNADEIAITKVIGYK